MFYDRLLGLVLYRMEKLTEQEFEKAQQEYLDEGINWDACKNEVIKTADKSSAGRDDVEQFACDTFHAGVLFMVQKYGIDWTT